MGLDVRYISYPITVPVTIPVTKPVTKTLQRQISIPYTQVHSVIYKTIPYTVYKTVFYTVPKTLVITKPVSSIISYHVTKIFHEWLSNLKLLTPPVQRPTKPTRTKTSIYTNPIVKPPGNLRQLIA